VQQLPSEGGVVGVFGAQAFSKHSIVRPGVTGPHAAGEENFLLEGDDDSSVVEGGNNKPGLKAAALAPNLLISSFLRLACLLSCSLKDGLRADMSTTGLGIRP
jgi:hypothetical protein